VKLEYTHALQEYDIYRDELEALRNKIEFYQESFNSMQIVAPISGIIMTKIENKLGTFVKKGDEIGEVANMDEYYLELAINEKYINHFTVGDKASIRFSSYPQKHVSGKVVKIQHAAWEKVKKVLVKENVINVLILPEDTYFAVKPGMTANIKIHCGKIGFRWNHFVAD